MYKATDWKDHVTEFPNRRTLVENPDGTVDVVKAQGELIQQGTPQSATNFNNIENGMVDAHLALGLLLNYARQNSWEIERGTANLTNGEIFPFNNSIKTISLERGFGSKDYIVLTETVSAVGNAGGIEISDKLVNGFKIAFNGSAKSAVVKYTVLGGYLK